MPKKTPAHGGKRTGSGRPPTGRTSTSKSITLKNKQWEEIDSKRGNLSPSGYIESQLFKK